MNVGLSEDQLHEIQNVLAEFEAVESAVLFGSRAMKTHLSSSDVDIAIIGDTISLKDQIKISARLNESKSLLRYDVIRYSTIKNERLIEHIKKHGVTIYKKVGTDEKFF